MKKSFQEKIEVLMSDASADTFILADAKDPDMARGVASAGRAPDGSLRSMTELYQDVRMIVESAMVDIMLMSASTSYHLTVKEGIFENSPVTPAVRANDTSDLHVVRGGRYVDAPSRPFSTSSIDQIQMRGSMDVSGRTPAGANLGLYSVTFNNDPVRDLETMQAYNAFRDEADAKGFKHFLEVFLPNVPPTEHGLAPEDIPGFVNDHIVRLLAGVPQTSRPLFLKLPYMGGAAVAELCNYDPSIIVGVLGGSAGTTFDAYHLVEDAKRHGARVALFGRKIIAAEDQLTFIEHLRHVAENRMKAAEAVKSYHDSITRKGLQPKRSLADDLESTTNVAAYKS